MKISFFNTIFNSLFALSIIWILAMAAAIFYLLFTASNLVSGQDWSGGVKPVIEKLWCGKPGCTDGAGKHE